MSLSKEEKLAQELADTLDDQAGYAFFLICTEKYAESHIRKILKKTLSIPQDQIRKNRAALFTYLIRQHERRYNSGD